MYFNKFNTIQYDLGKYRKQVTNILIAALPIQTRVDRDFVFQKYIIKSGETPESLAESLYEEPNYYWVNLVINDIVNPFYGWPMSDLELEEYTARSYHDIHDVHHFERFSDSKIYDELDEIDLRAQYPNLAEDIRPVTNLEYEIRRNNALKHIRVVNPRYVSQFVEEFQRAVEGKAEDTE